ncbi:SPT2 chromatin protein-domain-containing protein [Scheffersomyces coipomensis]|uniref:SPT2 chromatin protein-domain-containing protein n=1 Tax=Scheffersomyces coipomensis TaxID=1788519 RepID=UPI00315CBDB1
MLTHDKKERKIPISSGSGKGLTKGIVKSNAGINRGTPSKMVNTNASVGGSRTNTTTTSTTTKPTSVKKFKFNELMKKASKVDQTKLSINFSSRSKSPETTSTQNRVLASQKRPNTDYKSSVPNVKVNNNQIRPPITSKFLNNNSSTTQKEPVKLNKLPNREIKTSASLKSKSALVSPIQNKSRHIQKTSEQISRTVPYIEKGEKRKELSSSRILNKKDHKKVPVSQKSVKSSKIVERDPVAKKSSIPFRGPSAKLQENLNKRQKVGGNNNRLVKSSRTASHNSDDDDDDMSSFIASDEEEEEGRDLGYNRDEIWAIFNKGNKRSYNRQVYSDSDSDSDMEATGADILEEENRSRRTAELEDKRELEQEKRLSAMKKARKAK